MCDRFGARKYSHMPTRLTLLGSVGKGPMYPGAPLHSCCLNLRYHHGCHTFDASNPTTDETKRFAAYKTFIYRSVQCWHLVSALPGQFTMTRDIDRCSTISANIVRLHYLYKPGKQLSKFRQLEVAFSIC